jgi:hypothetical protein
MRLSGGQELLGPTRQQLQQQTVQTVDRLGTGMPEFVTVIDQQTQSRRAAIDLHLAQSLGA